MLKTVNYLIFIFFLSCTAIAEEQNDRQEFTFLTETAYLQEANEWQVNLLHSRLKCQSCTESKVSSEISIEYGFSNLLQFELSINSEPNFSNDIESEKEQEIEIGASYALIEETNTSPLISTSFSIISEDELGVELAVSASKSYKDRHTFHLTLSTEKIEDEKAVSLSSAYIYSVNEALSLIAEWQKVKESTHSDDEYYSNINAGLIYNLDELFSIGLGYQKTDNEQLRDNINLKMTMEF